MERAQPGVAARCRHPLQAHVLADYRDDVDRRLQLLDEIHLFQRSLSGRPFRLQPTFSGLRVPLVSDLSRLGMPSEPRQ